VQVGILGPLEVGDERGLPVPVTGARLRALLVRLALDAGRPVGPGVLVDAVWGAQPPADEANALQTLVSRLRRALGDPALIVQSAAGYQLAVPADAVDATRFERLAADGSRALRNGEPDRAATLLREAGRLWRGPALVDGGDAVLAAAARLADLRLAAVVDRLSAEILLGEAESAAAELEALVAEYPLDERIARQLVTALAASGRQADALRAYERTRERLADELGVDPSAELQAAHLAVLRGQVDPAPDAPARRTNLKAQLTSFVGREEEVARVGKVLEENRLVTLVGPGGAGKTRLANEAGAKLVTRDGVWLAELAPVTDAADVAQTVLGALGLREKNLLDRRPTRAAPDAEGRLVDVLADKAAVLVLDNCEHLIDASARLAEQLLGLCPDLRVLATSREPLGITGEVVLAVPPLGQPHPDAGPGLAIEYPAVRLFADRAAAADPDFAVDDTTVATVIDIVRRLDGLPLAIELAAARLRSLPLTEIADRLSDRFRLLTGGSRTALPRHRTLRAVVEWSWGLLAEPERVLVERLAVFPGGVIVDSARSVADELVPADDVADLLSSLVDKSLLQRVDGGARLRMLETIREYGTERLAERGELAEVRRRAADYFAALLEAAEAKLTTAEQVPWFNRLNSERDNILAALRFRCDAGDADGALRVAIGYGSFSMMLGQHAELSALMNDALSVPGATDDDLRWIAAALLAMNAAAGGRDADEVTTGMNQLREVAGQLRTVPIERYPVLGVLRPAVAFFAGDRELTQQMVEEGLLSPNDWVRAAVRMFRATLYENDGQTDAMRADVDIALAEFRRIGERWGLANTLRSKALLDSLAGNLDAAAAAYEEARSLMAELRSREDEAYLLVRLAEIAMRQGDTVRARELVLRARQSADESGAAIESVFTVSMLAEIERQAGSLDRARALHREAMHRISAMPAGHPAQGHSRTMVLALSARLAAEDGDLVTAAERAGEAYTAALGTNDLPITAAVGVVVAVLAAASDRPEVAAEVLGASARLRGGDDPTAPDIARLTTVLRAELGPDGFAHGYACGKDLDRAAALQRLDPAGALAGDRPAQEQLTR
jgi:predicted ATPase/DNA-binding SARP family transcriptional activator